LRFTGGYLFLAPRVLVKVNRHVGIAVESLEQVLLEIAEEQNLSEARNEDSSEVREKEAEAGY
jgi:hypothetical protein